MCTPAALHRPHERHLCFNCTPSMCHTACCTKLQVLSPLQRLVCCMHITLPQCTCSNIGSLVHDSASVLALFFMWQQRASQLNRNMLFVLPATVGHTTLVPCLQRRTWRIRLCEPATKLRLLLEMGVCSLRSMLSHLDTLRSRYWQITMAMLCTCMKGTAQCSDDIKRSRSTH